MAVAERPTVIRVFAILANSCLLAGASDEHCPFIEAAISDMQSSATGRDALSLLSIRKQIVRSGKTKALQTGYGQVGSQICAEYADDFAANGSDRKACNRWPVRDLCTDSAEFCAGNLNMQRCEMPQIPSAFGHHPKFESWKKAAASEGINITTKSVKVSFFETLLPSQRFMSKCKVCSLLFSSSKCVDNGPPTAETCKKHGDTQGCFCSWTDLKVTKDHVLDGHHRWAASKIMLADGQLPSDTDAVIELYSGADDQHEATIIDVVTAAQKHPRLVKHTKCSSEVENAP